MPVRDDRCTIRGFTRMFVSLVSLCCRGNSTFTLEIITFSVSREFQLKRFDLVIIIFDFQFHFTGTLQLSFSDTKPVTMNIRRNLTMYIQYIQ